MASNNKNLAEIVQSNGGWLNVLRNVTTALTPVWATRMMVRSSVPEEIKNETNFLSNFVMPTGKKGVELGLNIKKERSMNVVREISQHVGNITNSIILEPLQDTMDSVKQISNSFRKVVYGAGQTLFKVKDGNKWIENRNLVRKHGIEQVAPEFKKRKGLSSENTAHSLFIKSRLETKGTLEHDLLHSYTHPKALGRIHSSFSEGWDGFQRTISMLPTPSEYLDDRHTVMMGYVVAGNKKGYMGASIGKCELSQDATLEYMLNRAHELGLNIPKRPDGKEWSKNMKIAGGNPEQEIEERKIFRKCLAGTNGAPFLVNKNMMQGSSILIRDKNLVDAELASSELSPNSVAKNINEWKKESLRTAERKIEFATSPDNKKKAIALKDRILNVKDTYDRFLDEVKKEELESFKVSQKEREASLIGIQSNIDQSAVPTWGWEDDIENSWGTTENNLAETPLGQMKEITWTAARGLGMKLNPKNTLIHIDPELKTVHIEITIGQTEKELMQLPNLEKIRSDDSISLKNLSEGHYKTQGVEHTSLDVVNNNGKKQIILNGVGKEFNDIPDITVNTIEKSKNHEMELNHT